MVAIMVIPHIGKDGLPRLSMRPNTVGISVAVAAVMLAKANRMRIRAATRIAIIMEGGICSTPSPPSMALVNQLAAPVSTNACPTDTAEDATMTTLPMLARLLSSFQDATPM